MQGSEPSMLPMLRQSPSGIRSVPIPQQAHHNPCIIPLQALRAITTSLAQLVTTVLRGHPGRSPVQQGPLEETPKQQQLESASRAPQAPSVPCQGRQHASPVGVLPSLPRVSPGPCLPLVAVILIWSCSLQVHRVLGCNPHVISNGGPEELHCGRKLSAALCAWPPSGSWARSWLSSESMALLRDYP